MHIPVAEIMSRDLLIVHPENHLDKVDEIFQSHNIHHIPVVETSGRLVGMISKLDFSKVNHVFTLFDAEQFGEYNQKLYRSMTVDEIMTKQLATVAPDDPLTVATDIFKENLFHALPVVDRDTLVGLLTTHDVLNYCCSEMLLLE